MTNRELLNNKTNEEIGTWLNENVSETVTEAPETDWTLFPNFKPSEFKCPCGKCEYSTEEGVKDMNPHLLEFLQFLRKYYGKAVSITCGARCQEYNDSLTGSIKNSKHISMDAADFYIQGITSTESGRDAIVKMAKAMPKYNYAYHNKNGQYPNMGSAVHCDFAR